MTYVKNTWIDQEVERPKTYEMTNNPDGSVTLIDSFGIVTELGTPVNADNMNHIEDGIAEHEERITLLEEDTDTSNYVQKSGDTMTGNLTVEKDTWPIIFIKNSGQDRSVSASTNAGTQYLYFSDKNNETLGSVGIERYTNGRNTIKLQAFSPDGTFAPAIRVHANADNTASFTLSANPANTSNGTDIATTSFCDGNWTYEFLELAKSVVLSNTANTTFNLASYLPNDGRTYEVLLSYNGSATSSSQYNFDTGFGTMFGFAPIDTNISGIAILPVTTRRSILVMPTTITKGTNTYSFRINAYRKVR